MARRTSRERSGSGILGLVSAQGEVAERECRQLRLMLDRLDRFRSGDLSIGLRHCMSPSSVYLEVNRDEGLATWQKAEPAYTSRRTQ